MNKEILFRAWKVDEDPQFSHMITTDRGVMTAIQHCYSGHGMASNTYFSNCDNQPYPEKYILMQYTGILDKKDKKIFEGDIVSASWYTYDEPIDDQFGVIEYFESICGFVIWNEENKNYEELNDQGAHVFEIEVIGNIHDNPKLMEIER